ncbi:MAG: DUF3179 domain-containing protein [Gemmatimonadota bacterium]|nr:DUF3179 domain-containing protein [Gemmatimonadota bacterium]MDH3423027.1 DUF3179 domain-containing protein [Gemmatimonadota bacterium]
MGALLVAGCTEYEPFTLLPFNPDSPQDTYCSISTAEIFIGSAQDAIPALTNPRIVAPGHAETAYIGDNDRVIGIRAGVDALAIPLSILRYHEIVNVDFLGGLQLAVTHCPLTGSSLAFDRGPAGDAEFGVSGLLYRNNLMMYDRNSEESLWPQMVRGARCGSRDGTALQMHPVVEMTWSAWREMHPTTWVVSDATGYPNNNYQIHPYGDYDENDEVSWPTAIDTRRHPKERTLGVIDASGGVGYPFGELESLGPIAVVDHAGVTSAQGGTVVFWDGAARSAMAYSRVVDATELSFSVVADQIVDAETSSTWRVDGVATSGPLAGRRLDEVAEAYVAFWFAWAGFESGQTLWEAP